MKRPAPFSVARLNAQLQQKRFTYVDVPLYLLQPHECRQSNRSICCVHPQTSTRPAPVHVRNDVAGCEPRQSDRRHRTRAASRGALSRRAIRAFCAILQRCPRRRCQMRRQRFIQVTPNLRCMVEGQPLCRRALSSRQCLKVAERAARDAYAFVNVQCRAFPRSACKPTSNGCAVKRCRRVATVLVAARSLGMGKQPTTRRAAARRAQRTC